jgi:hypothetical protein
VVARLPTKFDVLEANFAMVKQVSTSTTRTRNNCRAYVWAIQLVTDGLSVADFFELCFRSPPRFLPPLRGGKNSYQVHTPRQTTLMNNRDLHMHIVSAYLASVGVNMSLQAVCLPSNTSQLSFASLLMQAVFGVQPFVFRHSGLRPLST